MSKLFYTKFYLHVFIHTPKINKDLYTNTESIGTNLFVSISSMTYYLIRFLINLMYAKVEDKNRYENLLTLEVVSNP